MAAAKFCEVLGKRNHMREFRDTANSIKDAAIEHLFSKKLNSFVRVAYVNEGKVEHEEVVDSSTLFGLWYFGMLDQDDPLFQATQQAVQERLLNPTEVGGFIRYEHDEYFRSTDKSNPWFITTLWQAQLRLRKEHVTDEDLKYARDTFDWVLKHAFPSGVLAEQLNPYTAESLSATPLVWSHAVYVETVLCYIEALERRGA